LPSYSNAPQFADLSNITADFSNCTACFDRLSLHGTNKDFIELPRLFDRETDVNNRSIDVAKVLN
jgi:hypothetical protein